MHCTLLIAIPMHLFCAPTRPADQIIGTVILRPARRTSAVSRPRAGVAGRRCSRRRRGRTANTLDEAVANSSNAVLKLVEVLRVPLGTAGSGNSVLAGERNIEDVVLVVAVVAVHAGAVAGSGEGDGGLADHGQRAVVTVSIGPHTVELDHVRLVIAESQKSGGQA